MTVPSASSGRAWFGPERQAAVADFWAVYSAHHEMLQQATMAVVSAHPEFGPLAARMMEAMSEAERAEQARKSLAQLERAFAGHWEEYETSLREQGGMYARMGLSFRGWHELGRAWGAALLPLLVQAYVTEPERLTGALHVMQDYLDHSMATIAEAYLEAKSEDLRRWEQIFQHAGWGVVLAHDADAPPSAVNPSFAQKSSVSEAEALRTPLAESFAPARRAELRERLRQAADSRQQWESERLCADGTTFPVAVDVAPIPDADGKTSGFAINVQDITERKQLEAERARHLELEAEHRKIREASRLKSEFLANMSHELRTPLNSIIGFSELLHDGLVAPDAPEYKEFLSDILNSGRHLLQLINDVLDLSKVEAGKLEFHPERVSLSLVTKEVLSILRTTAAANRIQLEAVIDPGLDEVSVDVGRLKQVLYNYLSNALKFTGAGGRVTLRIRGEDTAHFRLEVEDTGVGISAEDQARLFVEFQQLDPSTGKKHQGTGLGLALTRRLVEAQGGTVGVRSEPGRGSVFHAVLPRVGKGRKAAVEPMAPTNGGNGPAVLVVEDDAEDRSMIADALVASGYRVELAGTQAEAVALCREHRFDALTLDLLLPDGNGLEVLRAIRAEPLNQDVPVVVVTIVAEKTAVAGFAVSDVLPKPVEPEAVLKALERAGVRGDRSRSVLVVDDDAASRRLMAATLEQLGFSAMPMESPRTALEELDSLRPAAVILDLLMPEMDGVAFLEHMRRMPQQRGTPVLIWTVKDLSGEEQSLLMRSAQAVLHKGTGGALVEELRAFLPADSGS